MPRSLERVGKERPIRDLIPMSLTRWLGSPGPPISTNPPPGASVLARRCHGPPSPHLGGRGRAFCVDLSPAPLLVARSCLPQASSRHLSGQRHLYFQPSPVECHLDFPFHFVLAASIVTILLIGLSGYYGPEWLAGARLSLFLSPSVALSVPVRSARLASTSLGVWPLAFVRPDASWNPTQLFVLTRCERRPPPPGATAHSQLLYRPTRKIWPSGFVTYCALYYLHGYMKDARGHSS